MKINFGILTVSDTCSAGECEDKSGPNLKDIVLKSIPNSNVILSKCVPDQQSMIELTLREWSDSFHCDVILTTGGTGLSRRDVTPEATKAVIDREAFGMATAMICKGLESTPLAALSRLVCGTREQTLIVNLPGSVKGSTESFLSITPSIPHAVQLLKDVKAEVDKVHFTLGPSRSPDGCVSKVNVSEVASRPRTSQYPLVKVSDAQEMVLSQASLGPAEQIAFSEALGRVLACDVQADHDVPAVPTSTMDGYAVARADGTKIRSVRGSCVAGDQLSSRSLEDGWCVRINTGAPLPPGADCVVPVEDTTLLRTTDDGREEVEVEILSLPGQGANIRPPGCDVKAGAVVLDRGTLLKPADLGVLASVGQTQVQVYSLPRVAVVSTGNEIVDANTVPLDPSKTLDSNRPTLLALLRENGFPARDCGIVEDEPNPLLRKLKEALALADVVLTTGGVSMGERDMLKEMLKVDLGATIHFGRVFMKPGKPTTFATLNYEGRKKLLFCLPGNPVSATVCAYLFVLPALKKMTGKANTFGITLTAKIEESISLDPRPEYHRATLTWLPQDPVPIAKSTGEQRSSRLLSFPSANALLILPPRWAATEKMEAGSLVECLLLQV